MSSILFLRLISSGHGGGETFLGSTSPNPNGSIKADLPYVPAGMYITAIAIDAQNNTSEFSLAVEVTNSNNLSSMAVNSTEAKAFPNPFSQETSIFFEVKQSQYIKLSLLDFQGRLVQLMVDETLPKGKYAYQADLSMLPDGAYYYHLVDGALVKTGKLIKQGTGR